MSFFSNTPKTLGGIGWSDMDKHSSPIPATQTELGTPFGVVSLRQIITLFDGQALGTL